MSTSIETAVHAVPPRWLHWCALATVVAAVPLLLLGAFVTSMGVGMADQRGIVNPIQAAQEMATQDQSIGWKVEHSHRFAGWFIGLAGIALAAGSWWADPRTKGKWLATLALVLICVQGTLGIFRVRLNAWWGPELAWIHGCFAQLVFAVLVTAALLNSRGWLADEASVASGKLRHWTWLCLILVFAQLVLGGMIRHMNNLLVARLHLLTAFAVLAALLWLAKLSLEEHSGFRAATWTLMGLVALQILLGVEAWMPWMRRVLDPASAIGESVGVLTLRSLHYLVGTLLFANVVVIALKAHRGLAIANGRLRLSAYANSGATTRYATSELTPRPSPLTPSLGGDA